MLGLPHHLLDRLLNLNPFKLCHLPSKGLASVQDYRLHLHDSLPRRYTGGGQAQTESFKRRACPSREEDHDSMCDSLPPHSHLNMSNLGEEKDNNVRSFQSPTKYLT